MTSSTSAVTNGAVALDVLGLATPYITRAMRAVDPSGVQATAWGWRVLAKTAGLSGESQQSMWGRLANVLSAPQESPRGPLPAFKLIGDGKAGAAVGRFGVILKTANIVATCIVLFEAKERCKDKGVEPGVKEFSALMGLLKETAELLSRDEKRTSLLSGGTPQRYSGARGGCMPPNTTAPTRGPNHS